ncbi:MAG: acetyltransferase [Clostridia bacterium]|nr:acetyltransferase [Clostridia bacterium]
MKDLIIIGAGGLGRETIWTAERMNAVSPEWNILGFIDDKPNLKDKTIDGYKVLGNSADIVAYPDAYYVCAIGSAKIRKSAIEKIKSILPDIKFATLIDPACVWCKGRTKIGEGCIICAHTYITVDVNIGNHVYFGADGTIGHDARIDDFVTCYPGVNVSGTTHISEGCEIGAGSQIIQGISVGRKTIVGAGSVVIRDLPSDCTAVGAPAKPIKYHK